MTRCADMKWSIFQWGNSIFGVRPWLEPPGRKKEDPKCSYRRVEKRPRGGAAFFHEKRDFAFGAHFPQGKCIILLTMFRHCSSPLGIYASPGGHTPPPGGARGGYALYSGCHTPISPRFRRITERQKYIWFREASFPLWFWAISWNITDLAWSEKKSQNQ